MAQGYSSKATQIRAEVPPHVNHRLVNEYPAHAPRIRAEGSEDGTEPVHPIHIVV